MQNFEMDSFTTQNGKSLKITFFRHASLLLEYAGQKIFVDPVSDYADYTQQPKADFILITHEHSDHIKGLGVISRKYGIPIYTTGGTVDAMVRTNALGKIPDGIFHEIKENEPFEIGDLTVNPFSIPHDAAQPVGYRWECDGQSVGIATDLGKYND